MRKSDLAAFGRPLRAFDAGLCAADRHRRQPPRSRPTAPPPRPPRSTTRRRRGRAAGDTSEIVVTATRRNEALSDVPLAVSAVTAETLQNSGASDIRQLTQVSPVAARFLDLVRSRRGRRAYPRHRHGRRQSRPRKLGRGVHRRRLSLAHRRRPDRTRPGRPHRSAARAAGHLVRPQHLGRPDLDHHRQAASSTPRSTARSTIGNYDLRRVEARRHRRRSATRSPRALDGVCMKRDGFLEDVISGRDVNDRDRWLLRGQLLLPAERRSVGPPDRRLCQAQRGMLRGALPAGARLHRAATATISPRRIAAIERGLGGDHQRRSVRSRRLDHAGPQLSGRTSRTAACRARSIYDFGGAELTSITAYRYNKYVRGQDADFNNLDILYPRRRRQRVQPLQDLHPGTAPPGRGVRRPARLAGRRLLRQREAAGRRQSALTATIMPTTPTACVASNFAAAASRPHQPDCVNCGILVAGAAATCFNAAVAARRCCRAFRRPRRSRALAALIARLGAFAGGRFGRSAASPTSLGSPVRSARRLSFNGVGIDDTYDQTSNNCALFTHNIFDDHRRAQADRRRALHAREEEARRRPAPTITSLCACYRRRAAALAAPASAVRHPAASRAATSSNSTARRRESKLSGTVGAELQADRPLLTYVSYSRGYKAGGFNLDRAALPRSVGNGADLRTAAPSAAADCASLDDLQFKPEINDAFELGAKYNGRGFDVNVAAVPPAVRRFPAQHVQRHQFHRREHQQLQGRPRRRRHRQQRRRPAPAPARPAPASESRGVEVEVFTRPMPRRQLQRSARPTSTRAIATIWSAPTDEPLIPTRCSSCPAAACPTRRELTVDRLARLDPADRRQRHARPRSTSTSAT